MISEKDEDPVPYPKLESLSDTYLLILDPDTAQPTEVGPIELSRGDLISDISFRRSDGKIFSYKMFEDTAALENAYLKR